MSIFVLNDYNEDFKGSDEQQIVYTIEEMLRAFGAAVIQAEQSTNPTVKALVRYFSYVERINGTIDITDSYVKNMFEALRDDTSVPAFGNAEFNFAYKMTPDVV